MNIKRLFILLAFCPFCLAEVMAQANFCGIENKVITPGERVNFTVYYNLSSLWVAAGEASFSTQLDYLNAQPVFHLTGRGSTFKSYSWIYKVDDKYESFIDTTTLLPMKFERNINENGKKKSEYVRFVHQKQKAFSNNKTFSIPACTQDVLSAVYYARNINYDAYKPGDKIPFEMFIDEEVHHLYIRYLGKFTIKTRYGTFKTIKIKPLLVAGTIFSGGENMEIYVSDDENRIPVRISSPILVGSIKVDLNGYTGLRFPLSSLEK